VDRLTLLDLSGAPTAWRVVRETRLPEVQSIKGSRAEIQTAAAAPRKRFVLFYPDPDGNKVLRPLDVEGEREKFSPPVPVQESAPRVSVPNEKFAYLCVQPRDRGAGAVGAYDGTRMSIYDISDPEQIKQAGAWDPGYPTRDMELVPRPGKGDVVLVKEPGGGGGIQFADFSDPRKLKVLAEVSTNGEGNRVAAWGDRARYASSTLAQWFEVSDPSRRSGRPPAVVLQQPAQPPLADQLGGRWRRAVHRSRRPARRRVGAGCKAVRKRCRPRAAKLAACPSTTGSRARAAR
jgi:hypothetical protein